MENIYHQCWEQDLIYQFIKNDKCRKKAYICSPLSADKDEDFVKNMRTARAYMFYALKKMNLNEDLEEILKLYMPMIDRYSYLNGKLDEDMKQYIMIHIALNISKFPL